MVADGEHVEEGLRGVLVPAVARVDDVGRDPVRQELGGLRAGDGVRRAEQVTPPVVAAAWQNTIHKRGPNALWNSVGAACWNGISTCCSN